MYPIDLIYDIHRQPDNYAELLRPWQESLDQVWAEDIFQRQLQRWQDFRKWQNDNRDRKDEDDSFPAYVEREKSMVQRYFLRRSRAKRLAEIEADPSCLQSDWEDEQWERERQRRCCREHGCREFRDYVDAVKRRLASHDFTQSFDLDEDPKKQDRLTTWIEYLNYEYWWLDKYTSDIERLEPDHEKLWQELAERKILKSHETKEFVRTDASGMEREREKDQAMKAFQRAESEAKRVYVLTQEDPKRLRIPKTKRISMMKDVTEKLLAAKRRWEQARNQSFLIVQFVRATFGYAGAKRQAARQRILVQWVLDQVPLVEAEMKPAKSNGVKPGVRIGTKRQLTTDEATLERQASKRVKCNLRETTPVNARASSRTICMQPGSRKVMSQAAQDSPSGRCTSGDIQQENDAEAVPRGLRRSARIAARQDALVKAIKPKAPEHMSRSKTEAIAAKSPRQTPLVGHARARLSKTHSRRKNQDGLAKPGRRSERPR